MRVNRASKTTGPPAGPGTFENGTGLPDQRADQYRTSSLNAAIKTTGYTGPPHWSGLVHAASLVLVRSGGVSLDTPDGPPGPADQLLEVYNA